MWRDYKYRVKKYIWYFYIFLFLAFGVARLVDRLIKDSGGFSSQYLPLIISIIFSVGVYGAINQQPLFKLWFWKSFYWFSLLLSMALFMFAAYVLMVSHSILWSVAIFLTAIFIIPAQVKIRMYYFKSKGCWE